jgi:hypothetical protein
VHWINKAQDRKKWWAVANAVQKLRVPYNARGFLTNRNTIIFSRRTVFHVVRLTNRDMIVVNRISPELSTTPGRLCDAVHQNSFPPVMTQVLLVISNKSVRSNAGSVF